MASDATRATARDGISSLLASVATGRMILILGSVITATETPELIRPLSLVALTERLLEGQALPPGSLSQLRLMDALAFARQRAPQEAAGILSRALSVEGSAPGAYRRLLRGPWERIYDLVGSELWQSCCTGTKHQIVFADATQEYVPDYMHTQVI